MFELFSSLPKLALHWFCSSRISPCYFTDAFFGSFNSSSTLRSTFPTSLLGRLFLTFTVYFWSVSVEEARVTRVTGRLAVSVAVSTSIRVASLPSRTASRPVDRFGAVGFSQLIMISLVVDSPRHKQKNLDKVRSRKSRSGSVLCIHPQCGSILRLAESD